MEMHTPGGTVASLPVSGFGDPSHQPDSTAPVLEIDHPADLEARNESLCEELASLRTMLCLVTIAMDDSLHLRDLEPHELESILSHLPTEPNALDPRPGKARILAQAALDWHHRIRVV